MSRVGVLSLGLAVMISPLVGCGSGSSTSKTISKEEQEKRMQDGARTQEEMMKRMKNAQGTTAR